jgi:hypothetical protein
MTSTRDGRNVVVRDRGMPPAHEMTAEVNDARLEMVEQLDIALHGQTWARSASPREVWESLLDEVRRLRR